MFKRKKGQKYNNEKVVVDGIAFDSKKESQRYLVLKDAERQGKISDLELQVQYELIPAVKKTYTKHLKTKDKEVEVTLQRPITYRCDFRYIKDGEVVVEDVKASPNTASLDKVFLLKEKIFRWKFGFPIKRVYKATDTI